MNKLGSVLLGSVALTLLLFATTRLNCANTVSSDEDYQILSLAIADAIGDARPPETVVLLNETGPAADHWELHSIMERDEQYMASLTEPETTKSRSSRDYLQFKTALKTDTYDGYKQVNQTPARLENRFQLPVQTAFVTEADLKRLLHESPNAFWESFRKKFPHAIGKFFLSRPGFNSQHNQALVYVAYTSGPEGGDGRYVLLKKENGTWKVDARLIAWMS